MDGEDETIHNLDGPVDVPPEVADDLVEVPAIMADMVEVEEDADAGSPMKVPIIIYHLQNGTL
jgi:hypothetical protein